MLSIFSPLKLRHISRKLVTYPPRYPRNSYSIATMTIQSNADWQPAPSGTYRYFSKPIEKSPQDDRDYRLIRLENGLEAMLIHDAKADKAAASLDVAVGHLHDPDDMPGLAHFCEHLLFMGTEQFPGENEYSEYLSKNNGYSNAFTGTSNTNYFFNVATNALPGALTRFSSFFHSPLFAPSCTVRELNAVDSEHKKNHQSDVWRIFQLNKHLTKDGHAWNKFGSGNKDSLSKVGRDLKAQTTSKNGTPDYRSPDGSLAATPLPSRVPSPAPSTSSGIESEGDGGVVGRETRRRLVEWWSREYSANRMRLCVIGKEPLDELSELVAKLFSPIVNRDIDPLPMIHDHPFGPNEKGTLISVQTVMSFHAIEISWPFPYQPPHWRHQPGHFLAHFVGHEGPGSLHSYLKQKGWILALSAGPQNLSRGFAMFKITLRLTKSGFDNYREISLIVYKYLSLLRSSQFPAWYQKELATIKRTRFKFAEKRRPEDYALWVTEQLSWPVPRDQVLSAPQLIQEWDESDPMREGGGEKEMRDMLNTLTVDNSRAVLMARKEEHERLGGGERKWEAEPWYGTGYSVVRFDDDFIKEAKKPNDLKELWLPGPNEFIPTRLDVDKREVDQPAKRPHLIRETSLSSLWHKKDDQFWVPRAQVIIDIRSPVANETARAAVMTRLFAELVTDSLTEYSYDADLAGLNYNFGSYTPGVFITLNGYNDKLHVLAHHVFNKARTLQVKLDRLSLKKEELKRDWENFFLDQPVRVSDYLARYLLAEKDWTLVEKLAELQSISTEEVQEHINKFLSRVHMRVLVVGNMYKDEAIHLMETIEETLQSSPIPADECIELALIPQPGKNIIMSAPFPNPNEVNSALTYYVHTGSVLDSRLRVISALTAQILSEPAFNVLRTREQLGYIVSCTEWQLPGASERGLRIAVQSERVPEYLEERVEAFLEEMKTKIVEMGTEEFEAQRDGVEKKWKENVKNMSEETNRYWPHIDSGYLDFLRRETNVEVLKSVTKEDVVNFYMTYIHPSSPTRAKISVHMRSRKPPPKKINAEALPAIAEHVASLGVTNIPEGWAEELTSDGEALLEPVLTFWRELLTKEESGVKDVESALKGISAIADKFPAESQREGSISKSAVVITDPKVLKAQLKPSSPPQPVVEWGDLPVARF
ncbi:Metalloenzyme, LuxS/M16 peptidase-like protein [Cristinia sonorae]|uniref:Metalloenzyme, LuxS/M16 peptidase-like protein n=1 Tax=Cristinia sonorae TaxID=1940300 RepID=A0A8K0XP15_9AGAR|nr:Metalloenzyme, LuxS/M16 peptidase-like protein [Cristinia sonorae]